VRRWSIGRRVVAHPVLIFVEMARVGQAQAEPPLELDWTAPPECPTGPVVREDVLRMARVDERPLPSVRASVTVRKPNASDYILILTIGSSPPGAARTFHASTCRTVADAAAVTLALVLNPNARQERASQVSASAGPGRGPASSVRDVAPAEPRRRTRGADHASWLLRWGFAGLVGAQYGLLPELGPLFGGEVGAIFGPLSWWAGAFYGPQQETTVDARSGAGGQLALLGGAAYGCWAPWRDASRLGLCAGAEISQAYGRGIGDIDWQEGRMRWVSALSGPQLDLWLGGQFAVRLGGFLALPLARPSAVLENIAMAKQRAVVHQPARVGGRVYAGLAGHLP
jgi:hypothetical protein